MKKIIYIAAFAAALPWIATAQVEKQVEVTKAYVPSIESASKLAVVPDMTDTVKMRPEIDYTITPLSLRTTLQTRPIRPATVTYWEFNRPKPFYLKIGAGYPLNSVLDFYASTQNPGTGYVVGYVNHEGRYAKIENDFGVKNNSTQMTNRVGVAAGKYFGKRVLEGEVSYDNRLFHRYGGYVEPPTDENEYFTAYMPGTPVDYGDAQAAFHFGDDFKDLSRVNFEVAVSGGIYAGYSKVFEVIEVFPEIKSQEVDKTTQQTNFETHAKVARGFGRHRFSAEVGYERLAGLKTLKRYKEHIIRAGLRYGIDGGVARFEIGADYYHDRIDGRSAENYVVPFLHLDFNLGTPGLKPFVEIDGGLYDNSYRSMSRQNPYLAYAFPKKSSVDYNGRFGLCGTLWREKFNYRLYAGFSIRDNHTYWYSLSFFGGAVEGNELLPTFARQTVTSFNGEIDYRPISQFRMLLGVHGYLYNDDTKYENGSPSFEGKFALRYEGRKISFGAGVDLQSVRKWSVLCFDEYPLGSDMWGVYEVPFTYDVHVDFEWRVSRGVSIFAEGRNLANRRLYVFPYYPEYGANFTAGVKLNF